jgi:transposase
MCLEEGIIPNVHLTDNEQWFELETDYEPAPVSEAQINSSKAEDIKMCLRSGVIPKIYQGTIEDVEVVELKIRSGPTYEPAPFDSVESMVKRAQEGFFVRDLKTNITYCPTGEKLRFYCTKKGMSYYRNKLACERCLAKCCDTKFKTVGFGLGQNLVACRTFGSLPVKRVLKRTVSLRRVVRFKFYPDLRKLDRRKCLSEHPFGTVKRWHDGAYLLLRGKQKATGELSLSFLIYNIKRAINILGIETIMKAITSNYKKGTLFFSLKLIGT